jgi:peptidyl-prolyl cis-trans isomerase A (cyclophilin A)
MKRIFFLLTLITFLGGSSMAYAQDLEPGIYVKFETSKGEMLLKLEHEKTPITVANFVGLVEGNFKAYDSIEFKKPFYDGLTFHRVIADFMIQGGDPQGNGMGGPGYKFVDEFDPTLTHSGPGILSMANSGVATNGSQFFITHKATPHLNGRHTVFGHIITGQEVVNAIAQNDVMQKVTIIRVGREAEGWNATKVFNSKIAEKKAEEEKKAAKILKRNEEFAAYGEKIKNMTPEEYSKFMMKEVKKKYPKAQQSASGLIYMVLEEGVGEKPIKGDNLKVHYKGTFRLDGEEFDSSHNRNQTMDFTFQVQRMIAGFEEGLALLGKGGKALIFIPYHQGYGANGKAPLIPPYSDLVFELELVDLTPATGGTGHEGHGH